MAESRDESRAEGRLVRMRWGATAFIQCCGGRVARTGLRVVTDSNACREKEHFCSAIEPCIVALRNILALCPCTLQCSLVE